jgi:acyl carrier protein
MAVSKDAILQQLKDLLHDLFEVDPNTIKMDTKLYEDLDLDSIDAVDLIVHLQTLTERKFNPEEFKSVRTVNDVVNVIYAELNKAELNKE